MRIVEKSFLNLKQIDIAKMQTIVIEKYKIIIYNL